VVRGGVLVDGFLAATWSVAQPPRGNGGLALHLDPLGGGRQLDAGEAGDLTEDLFRFVAAGGGKPLTS
jgi:hypothetical protein